MKIQVWREYFGGDPTEDQMKQFLLVAKADLWLDLGWNKIMKNGLKSALPDHDLYHGILIHKDYNDRGSMKAMFCNKG